MARLYCRVLLSPFSVNKQESVTLCQGVILFRMNEAMSTMIYSITTVYLSQCYHQKCLIHHLHKVVSTTGLWFKECCMLCFHRKDYSNPKGCVAKLPEEVNGPALKIVALLCEQSVHQTLVGLFLPFQIVMLLHIKLTVPHQPLSQLAV